MSGKRFIFVGSGIEDNIEDESYLYSKDGFQDVCDVLNEQHETITQLKFQLQNTCDQRDEFHRGARENANALGLYERKVKETLQKHYNYAYNQRQKNLDNAMVAKAYDVLRYTVRDIADELGVELE